MRINKLFIIIVLASTIFMLSCSKDTDAKTNSKTNVYERGKPMSWGHEQTIYVFADSDIWKDAEYYIKYSLERPFYTVQNEKLYEIKLGDMNALDQFYKYKNLLFLCDLSSDKPVAQSVKKMMNTEMKDYVNNRGVGLFANHNHWANEQFVVF
ncbi:MAG: hypothetical protein PHE19_01515, partial [Candidatus Cloacimonetes bacterium]|nr:hypothetical protein [Candidatus Cloacimonadota bacterium]